ncbi:MAG: tripartite tricarboxylate transporter permease [Nanoarchaeota archaeon]|nr:tripartite tricarboxylate transporter permease [Nanoarchaeota archaeon]MBU4116679.1 tripartite tricarboxylate transporter permease [Nanoarchaeota archaeon]
MLIQLLLFMLIGIIAGTFTGLIPGIHINLISIFLVSASISFLSFIEPIYLITLITAMAITHTFIDFIPSVFLGCPDTDTELSVLPGHELLKKGQGYQAVILTAYGSLFAIFILILIAYPSIFLIEKSYNFIQTIIPYLLIIISLSLVLLEKNKISATLAFLLSGFLGLCVLNLPEVNQPLLPLLTGLFGSSALILSIKNKIQIPKQKITKPKIKILKPLTGALIASPLCSFLPGLGSGQAAIIGNLISRTNQKGFLVLLGATNTLVMGFSFICLYVISRTRTGAALAIQQIAGILSWKILILIIIISFIAGIISFFITLFLARFFSQKITKINYTKISIMTLILLTIVVVFIAKFIGLIILIASTFTGIYCILLKVKRTNMMGCLIIPTIFFYLM